MLSELSLVPAVPKPSTTESSGEMISYCVIGLGPCAVLIIYLSHYLLSMSLYHNISYHINHTGSLTKPGGEIPDVQSHTLCRQEQNQAA